ncbi:MAG: hypothetical protein ACP59X_06650 [Solidesulfovibrio sp. DCME]|uniref:hypothetical protein n=1 Tax=Solidesulfovibrio sp. DCME TaxID=3447380 RepID=UPI003D0DE036
MLKNLKREKPWAVLKVSRREYEAAKPWKRAGVSRAVFEELVFDLSDGFVDHCHMEVDAEKLVEGMFGKVE